MSMAFIRGTVRRAYRKKALRTHPDRLPQGATTEEREAANERFGKGTSLVSSHRSETDQFIVNNAYESRCQLLSVLTLCIFADICTVLIDSNKRKVSAMMTFSRECALKRLFRCTICMVSGRHQKSYRMAPSSDVAAVLPILLIVLTPHLVPTLIPSSAIPPFRIRLPVIDTLANLHLRIHLSFSTPCSLI